MTKKANAKKGDGRARGSTNDASADKPPDLDSRVKALATGLSTFGALDPGAAPEGSPTGTVTLGEKAGALAPMLAFDVLNEAAWSTAVAAAARLDGKALTPAQRGLPTESEVAEPPPLVGPMPMWQQQVVLVTEDPALLRSDLVTQQVHTVLKQWTDSLNLHTDLTTAVTEFTDATAPHVAASDRHMLPPGETPPTTDGQGATGDDVDKSEDELEPEAPEEPGPLAAITSVAGAVRNLAQMAAVDFTLTAVAVTPAAGHLARLAAGHLANESGHHVVLDGFGPVNVTGRTMTAFNAVQDAIRVGRTDVAELVAGVAATKANVNRLQLRADKVTEEWTAAVKDKDVPDDRVERLKAEVDVLHTAIADASVAFAPAQAIIEYASALIAAAKADVDALIAADAAGTSLLLRACSREALHQPVDSAAAVAGQRLITRVLCVEVPHLGADAVTRHSILGSSGRVGFLGSASTAWVLLHAQSGHIVGGAGQAKAGELTYDLEQGQARRSYSSGWNAENFGADPLRGIENALRYTVLGTALALLLLAVAAIAGVAHLWVS